jgi:hypothetical protein
MLSVQRNAEVCFADYTKLYFMWAGDIGTVEYVVVLFSYFIYSQVLNAHI